jgi:hypothetical protein
MRASEAISDEELSRSRRKSASLSFAGRERIAEGSDSMTDVFIVSAVRTPTGSSWSAEGFQGATELGALVVKEAVRRGGRCPTRSTK